MLYHDFNPVNGFVIDYMHGALLGVIDDLLELWCSNLYKDELYNIFSQVGQLFRLYDIFFVPYCVTML